MKEGKEGNRVVRNSSQGEEIKMEKEDRERNEGNNREVRDEGRKTGGKDG